MSVFVRNHDVCVDHITAVAFGDDCEGAFLLIADSDSACSKVSRKILQSILLLSDKRDRQLSGVDASLVVDLERKL